MALDIRLDFITNIDPICIEQLTTVRDMYIEIDKCLQMFADQASVKNNSAAARSVGLARTFNEQACQCTIKTICLLGEKKA